MGSAIAASKAQTGKKIGKGRERGLNLNSLPLLPCPLRTVKLNLRMVKSKGDQKGGKKSIVKKVKVTKQTPLEKGKRQLKEQLVKGPGPRVRN
ncbi:hypothetical protein H5410_006865 [Solanum commersonii]|uniref:Uncharacterized protein n=1 Tax=Solanum commersonii TaxID=4109 RepID=A0A9J6ACI9_SOLCO|nr:hypothetical protein H5410_006865 [Solanum commersonii]